MRTIILKGEGSNQHVLDGTFNIEGAKIEVGERSYLKHEDPTGKHAEHETLVVEPQIWFMGKQVEYNPFRREISTVWD